MGRMRCLVTGGAGFIGSHVAEQMVREGHDVRVIDNLSTGSESNLEHIRGDLELVVGDLRDPEACRRAAEGVEVVFHLAALPSVPRSMADPWASHDHNVNGTIQLLLAARNAGVRRMVFSSSSSIYGDTPTLPKVESLEPLPKSPYAAAKLAAEQAVLAYARSGMLEGVALRYFNVFGPRQSPTSAYAAVIPVFMEAALKGTPVPVNGDGGHTRDFTYIENVVSANRLAAEADAAVGWAINVGAGGRTSLLELIGLISEVSGKTLQVEHRPARAGDVRDSLASVERGEKLLRYRPLIALREGLERTWKWFEGTR